MSAVNISTVFLDYVLKLNSKKKKKKKFTSKGIL